MSNADVAMQLAEDARQVEWDSDSFTAELFMGNLRWDLIHPFPAQDPDDRKIGEDYIEKIRPVIERAIDPWKVDEEGQYPTEALDAMAEVGLFGMRIPKEYGGLGFSVTNYARVLQFIGGYCATTVAYLSAHQSIGVPQPVIQFGTEDQKRRLLPRLARGEVSAFSFTEAAVGSDPSRVTATARLTPDGKHYVLNGNKLYCTNVTGPKTSLVGVIARTPDKILPDGTSFPQMTCFVLETNWPGIDRSRRCHFMGLRGLENGIMTLRDVMVPVENMIGQPGDGLKIAITTLNIGRLGIPAGAIGSGMAMVDDAKWWTSTRQQWGQPIGKHQALAKLVSDYMAQLFAMRAMMGVTCSFADQDHVDIRLETLVAKYWASETLWRMYDEYLQARGGRGYERASSLYARGERPAAVEQGMRDARINRIFEGSTQVMPLMMTREALDVHFKLMMPLLKPKPGQSPSKTQAALKAAKFYAGWLPKIMWPGRGDALPAPNLDARNRKHLAYIAKTSKRLARRLFVTMSKYGPKLEAEQLILGNYMDIGSELFVMSTTLSYADHLVAKTPEDRTPLDLADLFCQGARHRIEECFDAVQHNFNRSYTEVADLLMDGKLDWLARGSINPIPPAYRDWEKNSRYMNDGMPTPEKPQ